MLPFDHARPLSRRAFLATTSFGAAGVLLSCATPGLTDPYASSNVRLTVRPSPPTLPGPLGLRRLGLGGARDGSIYVPASYSPASPAPMVLLLHGAGGAAESFITRRIPEADATGQIVLAVDSRSSTWDGVAFAYFDADIAFLDAVLQDTFVRYAVDPTRLAVAGFSDGATMALALGLANGDLLPRVVAWSPGFLIDPHRVGKPSVFITHGINDPVLPIDSTSRVIVPQLRGTGYTVEYREFVGVHEVPNDLLHETMGWMAASGGSAARSG